MSETQTKSKRLTREQKDAIRQVLNGADVRSYKIAKTLREVEREHPGLIEIGKCQMGPYSVHEHEPYFGCIATAAGREAVK